ncbi:MAG: TRAP transporter substrate-binding protein DctP [Chloroflexi bacterium]|nr:TRAP transporter substrate-binding protein DctP [Chloroflexota bacterium]
MSKRRISVAGMAGVAVLLAAALLASACAKAPGPAPTVTVTAPAPTVTVTAPAPASTPTPTTPASTAKFTLTYAFSDAWGRYAPYNEYSKPGGYVQRLLYNRSGGRLQLKVVPKMFPVNDALKGVAGGEADITDLGTTYYHATYPIFGWVNLPVLYRPSYLEGINLLRQIVERPDLQKIYDEEVWSKLGLVSLAPMPWGFGNLVFSNKKVAKLEDFNGFKVRTYTALMVDGYKLLGATPMTIAFGEVATAMKTGVVDGYASSMASGTITVGGDKLAKYIIRSPLVAAWESHFIMNKKTYDKLPPDLQKVVRDVFWELGTVMGNFGAFSEKLLADKIATDAGMEFVELPAADIAKAQQILAPLEAKYLSGAGPRGKDVLAIVKQEIDKFNAFNPNP